MSDQTATLPAVPELPPVPDQPVQTQPEQTQPEPPERVSALDRPHGEPQVGPFARALRETHQQVVCPECGTASPVQGDRRAASDFCPSCDYPLFWAPGTSAPTLAQETGTDALYRSPGASGTSATTTLPCPACGERNLPVDLDCVRCGAAMTPPPPPVVPEPPAPVPAPVVVIADPLPCTHPQTWVVALLSAAATLVLTLVVVWAW